MKPPSSALLLLAATISTSSAVLAQQVPGQPPLCAPGGCSGTVCISVDDPSFGAPTTCEWSDWYNCFQSSSSSGAKCEVQPSGKCGWTVNDPFRQCLTTRGAPAQFIDSLVGSSSGGSGSSTTTVPGSPSPAPTSGGAPTGNAQAPTTSTSTTPTQSATASSSPSPTNRSSATKVLATSSTATISILSILAGGFAFACSF
ncbi:hypothetical protein HK102_009560 [Quaeritorhiza haematococci]|nr:hypothetical protein HK102_009560 [Quaeritorhiza haematococci]